MVVDEGRHGADLDGVGVIGRVLEQAVVGVKELTRHQEKELSRRATVVQPVNTRTNFTHFTSASVSSEGTAEQCHKNISFLTLSMRHRTHHEIQDKQIRYKKKKSP